ncbi:uncharacterized protein LOC107046264 [Diachasma alloeum]|uniref:uncharacterized protein LOC107046264 n=1 Tax=Diachasma alloeum TaxID=454923 RepID=UPI000738450D|nr:uncharacterized protein LOC107046264 [Diachasma alloeum]
MPFVLNYRSNGITYLVCQQALQMQCNAQATIVGGRMHISVGHYHADEDDQNNYFGNDADNFNIVDITCQICLHEARDIIFLPCGHVAACTKCTGRLKEVAQREGRTAVCPTCFEDIRDTAKVHIT